jgi:hypothetical protein
MPKTHLRRAPLAIDSEQLWPDDLNETLVVLPETPRVRLSPRRKINPQTPNWPVGDTIRMYHDPEEDEEQTVNCTMNADFIESCPLVVGTDWCRYEEVYSGDDPWERDDVGS